MKLAAQPELAQAELDETTAAAQHTTVELQQPAEKLCSAEREAVGAIHREFLHPGMFTTQFRTPGS